MESSLDSLGDVFLDSGRKTRSARRRTTQIINITMTKVRLQAGNTHVLSGPSFHWGLETASRGRQGWLVRISQMRRLRF